MCKIVAKEGLTILILTMLLLYSYLLPCFFIKELDLERVVYQNN